MAEVQVPSALAANAIAQGDEEWLTRLPLIVGDLERRWALTAGAPFQPGGQTAWVAPALTSRGEDLVLKICRRHPEAEHEADGLRAWDGQGAVRLHATETLDDVTALLLERCVPGTALGDRPEPEQDVVLAGLLARLWNAPATGQRLRPLADMCELWADGYESLSPDSRQMLDVALQREGIGLFRTLPSTADRSVLLCTDLHAGNVLAAEREPWLVIDPKPYVGDPTYDALQHMLNCEARLRADPAALAARMAELLGLDAERLTLWLFARCVQESPRQPWLAAVARRLAPH